jgi:hypothetical protein
MCPRRTLQQPKMCLLHCAMINQSMGHLQFINTNTVLSVGLLTLSSQFLFQLANSYRITLFIQSCPLSRFPQGLQNRISESPESCSAFHSNSAGPKNPAELQFSW